MAAVLARLHGSGWWEELAVKRLTDAELLRLWREREMQFPAFTRRMTPDAMDYQTGVWDRHAAICEGRLVE